MPAWVAIAEREGGDADELPTEKDGSLLLASLTNHYPSVTTLKYKGLSGIWRIVRCVDGILTPPDDDGSWGSHVYICIKKKETPKENEMQLKRKADYGIEGNALYDDGEYDADDDSKNWSKSILCSYETGQGTLTENDFRDYFSRYSLIQSMSMKPGRGNNFGTAFIAFNDPLIPMSLYGKDIEINGVPIDVKEPETNDKERRKLVMIFRKEDLTKDELREHFKHYGRVTDVYIPKPFKYFGLVTFAKERVSRSLYGEIHKYKGTELRLQEPRAAKKKREREQYREGGCWEGMGMGDCDYMGMVGGFGSRGAGMMDQFGGGYMRPEKKQKRMVQGGFGQGRMGQDNNWGHWGPIPAGGEPSANQSPLMECGCGPKIESLEKELRHVFIKKEKWKATANVATEKANRVAHKIQVLRLGMRKVAKDMTEEVNKKEDLQEEESEEEDEDGEGEGEEGEEGEDEGFKEDGEEDSEGED